jgi:hypothetical protein
MKCSGVVPDERRRGHLISKVVRYTCLHAKVLAVPTSVLIPASAKMLSDCRYDPALEDPTWLVMRKNLPAN